MKQLSTCYLTLLIALLAMVSSYGNVSNIIAEPKLESSAETQIILPGSSFHINEGTLTNFSYQDTISFKSNSQLYITGSVTIFISKNSITNAKPVYLKKNKKVFKKANIVVQEKNIVSTSKSQAKKYHSLPKNKETNKVHFIVVSGTTSAPTSVKLYKCSITLQNKTEITSIFRKRKATKKCSSNTAQIAFQKNFTYALFSRPPTSLT